MASIENQPLIVWEDFSNSLSSETVEEILERSHQISIRGWLKLIAWESRVLWYLSGATIIVSTLCFMLTTVTLMFAGHLGSLPLAGASIACIGIQGLAFGIMVCYILTSFLFNNILSYFLVLYS